MKTTILYTLLFGVIFLSQASLFSQTRIFTDKTKGEYLVSWKAAWHKQKLSSYGEMGVFLGIASRPSTSGSGIVYGPSLSTELFLKDEEGKYTGMVPKIGFECYNRNLLGWPFGGRINLMYYSNSNGSSLKLGPEIGISIWHFINIFYGYNIPLTNKEFIKNNGHKLNVMMNYPIYIENYKKKKREPKTP